jgi:hypothetical protein
VPVTFSENAQDRHKLGVDETMEPLFRDIPRLSDLDGHGHFSSSATVTNDLTVRSSSAPMTRSRMKANLNSATMTRAGPRANTKRKNQGKISTARVKNSNKANNKNASKNNSNGKSNHRNNKSNRSAGLNNHDNGSYMRHDDDVKGNNSDGDVSREKSSEPTRGRRKSEILSITERRARNKLASAKYRQRKNKGEEEMNMAIEILKNRCLELQAQVERLRVENASLKSRREHGDLTNVSLIERRIGMGVHGELAEASPLANASP